MEIFCGIDWSEAAHDVAVVDETGRLLARRRIADDAARLVGVVQDLEAVIPARIVDERYRRVLRQCRGDERVDAVVQRLRVAAGAHDQRGWKPVTAGARLHQSGMLRQPRVLIAIAEGKDGITQDDARRG